MTTYRSKEVAEAIGMTRASITHLCLKNKLQKTKNIYQFHYDVWYSVLAKKHLKKLSKLENKEYKLPEVIYVHTTWTILESKLNFE